MFMVNKLFSEAAHSMLNGVKNMIIFHASKMEVEYPEVRKARYTKDFSWGFYCTSLKDQAIRWANRAEGTPVVNRYSYIPNNQLKILQFSGMSDEWLDFIADCRSGKTHSYDIVEGPMADDTIWNYVNDYINGTITRKQFWALAEFRHPTHQISFHTLQALDCLTFEGSEVLYD